MEEGLGRGGGLGRERTEKVGVRDKDLAVKIHVREILLVVLV